MKRQLKIGAVTVTYNSGGVISTFLDCFLRQSYPNVSLYVVDNVSTDDTLDQIAKVIDSRVRLIVNGENVGIAEGNNQGIHTALEDGCDAILLINNDTEFDSALVEKLAAGLEEYNCGMITPKILYYDRPHTIWSAGGGFNPFKGYAGFHYGLGEVDHGQFDRPRDVKHAPACCVLIRKEVFAKVGLMDGRYFCYLDDTDFSYRATKAGVKIAYLPAATLLHKASTLTGGPESEFSIRYRTRNQIYFMLKHLGPLGGLFYLPAFQLYQLAKLLSHRIDLSGFRLRQRSFLEGLRIWRQSQPSRS